MNKLLNCIKQDALIADIAMDFLPEVEIPSMWDVLDRYHQAGFHFLNLAVGGELTSLDSAIRYLSRVKAKINTLNDKFLFVETVEDINRAKHQKKLGLGFWFQGSTPLANDLNLIETYYKLGIRQILLVYNTRSSMGDGLLEEHDVGLSAFGHRVIQEMNRVGMLIDLSHAGIKTSLDVIEVSKDPVLFSHSNTQGVHPHIRNLTDEQIRAIAKNKGLIGINGMGLILGVDEPNAHIMFKHIDYIAQLVGSVDNIALGLDFVFFHEMLPIFYDKSGIDYPKGYLGSMKGFKPEQIDELLETLNAANYSEIDMKKILGENFLRIASSVWK